MNDIALIALQLKDLLTQRHVEVSEDSTKEMEAMTAVTYRIALKTEKETVAMKIITLVTLLFLPATFVSVRFERHQAHRAVLTNMTRH